MSILSTRHAIWLAGFRPFFLLAALYGAVMPVLWALVFSGYVVLPEGVNSLQWHVHEMLFGFGGAVLFGFLLTASKNWVKIRGIHGGGLMGLVILWLLERVMIYLPFEGAPLFQAAIAECVCAYIRCIYNWVAHKEPQERFLS